MITELPNSDDPIVPGRSAAGISIGDKVEQLLKKARAISVEERSGRIVHIFSSVKIWSVDGSVKQIGVYAGYRGLIDQTIGIGSTIAQIEGHFHSRVVEDEEDNLIVAGQQGWCFESEEWIRNTINNGNARVTAIFVFLPNGT